jgi:hypothetical protein
MTAVVLTCIDDTRNMQRFSCCCVCATSAFFEVAFLS